MSHANIDIENNDRFVWYVCEECRGEVKPFDPVCPHCGPSFTGVISFYGIVMNRKGV